MKKIIIAFLIIFVAIIIIFASNTNIDQLIKKVTSSEKPFNKDSANKADSIKRLYLLGLVDPSKDTLFAPVKAPYSNIAGLYMLKVALDSFKVMYQAAKKDGIELPIISATRNFSVQKSIWEGKFSGSVAYNGKNLANAFPDKVKRAEYILHYSSMPGTSRHHWGTDIDIYSVQLAYFETPTGKKLYKWLSANAGKYGFCQPYSAKDSVRTTGYEEEKWHWSFYPVASRMLADYDSLITYDDITGFLGWETAKELDVIKNYVNAVNQNCK